MNKKKIAIIGSGISGLSAALFLSNKFDVHLFEKNKNLGGHTRTINFKDNFEDVLSIDTGFIVFNNENYPDLVSFFKQSIALIIQSFVAGKESLSKKATYLVLHVFTARFLFLLILIFPKDLKTVFLNFLLIFVSEIIKIFIFTLTILLHAAIQRSKSSSSLIAGITIEHLCFN